MTFAPRVSVARVRGARLVKAATLVGVVLLAGCVSSLSYEPADTARTYVVRRGDTLYKIAWQHGVDQRDLARWNGLRNPDLIHVGQRLRLSPPAAASRPAQAPTQSASAPRTTPAPAPAPRPAPPPAPAPALPPPQWVWPTDGQVVTRFGAPGGIATGVGIAGSEGQPVRAAAAGRVVYVGSGLIGYGQLVIIKHNDVYLSAYGYNDTVVVGQGQDVVRGQTIATMGRGPERQARLHFEIRRNGVPADPLQLLSPRR